MKTGLDFDDVLIIPKRTTTASRKDVVLEREFYFYHSPKKWVGIPIIASNMACTGTFAMARELMKCKMITCLSKHYTLDELYKFYIQELDSNIVFDYVWASIGMSFSELSKLVDLQKRFNSININDGLNICIDIANGYTETFVNFCKAVREEFPVSIIMAGNVATPEMASELIIHGGVDIVKVGIGPGSACTTRLVTGVGYPQLTAIDECSQVHGLKSAEKSMGLQCGDGGCRAPGDICKAFASNADFVMLGGILAGVAECDGEWDEVGGAKYSYVDPDSCIAGRSPFVEGGQLGIDFSGRSLGSFCTHKKELDNTWMIEPVKCSLQFYGMSSEYAQDKHGEGLKDYRASEGRVISVPYKGPVSGIIAQILGGLRSCCTYVGATSLKDLPKCASFIEVNRPHNNMEYSWYDEV